MFIRYLKRTIFIIFILIAVSCNKKDTSVKSGKKEIPDFTASCSVDRVEATVGDIITYTVEANYKPTFNVNMPGLSDEVLSGLKVIDSGKERPAELDSLRRIKKWYKLQSDTVGSYKIPSLNIVFTDDQGNESEIDTDEIYINVKSAIGTEQEFSDIIDIKPLATASIDYTDTILILSGIIVSIVLIVLLIISRLKKEKEEVMVLIPAHELAFKELDSLDNSNLLNDGRVKEFHFKLSEIFRRYMEARYSFNAFESTTEEILPILGKIPDLDEVLKGMAKTLLRTTDIVKFTDFSPSDENSRMELSRAYKFVEQTREHEEELVDEKETKSKRSNDYMSMII